MSHASSPLARAAGLSAAAALVLVPLAFDPGALGDGAGTVVDAGLEVKRAVLVAAAATAAALGLLAAARGALRIPLRGFDVATALFVGLGLASAAWAVYGAAAVQGALLLAGAAAVGLACRSIAGTPRGAGRVLALVAGGTLAACGVDLLLRNGVPADAGKFGSLLFTHDNVAALSCAPVFALLLVAAAHQGSRRRRLLAAAGVLLAGAFLVRLGSRTGILAAAAAPALTVLLLPRRPDPGRRRRWPGDAGVLVLAVLAVTLLPLARMPAPGAVLKEGFNRVVAATGVDYATAYMRPDLWRNVLDVVADHPAGVGLGNLFHALPLHERDAHVPAHAHQQVLQTAAEVGLAGAVLVMLLWLIPLREALRAGVRGGTSARARERRVLARGVAAGLVALGLQGLAETPLAFPAAALTAFVLAGVALGLAGARPREVPLARRSGVRQAALALAAVLVLAVIPAALAPVGQARALRDAERARAGGHLDAAAAAYARAAAIGPDHYAIHWGAGVMELQRNRPAAALDCFEQALAVAPNHWAIHLQAALARIALGRTDAALAGLDRAAALNPGERSIGFWRGQALLHGGRLDQAIEVLERHRRAGADSLPALLAVGDARYGRLVRGGARADAEAARDAYVRCAAVAPDATPERVRVRMAELRRWQPAAPPRQDG